MNPELERNFHLEFTKQRLLAAGLILFFAYLPCLILDFQKPNQLFFETTYRMSRIFVIILMLCVSIRISNSVIDEIRDATWDWLRLSSLSSWQIIAGKILSTPVEFLSLIFSITVMQITSPLGWELSSIWIRTYDTVSIVLVAFLLILTCMHGSISQINRHTESGRRRFTYPSPSIFINIILLPFFITLIGWNTDEKEFSRLFEPINYYGFYFSIGSFKIVSLLLFNLWMLFSVSRIMGRELQNRQIPWALSAFTVFLCIYVLGFDFFSKYLNKAFLVSSIAISIAYCAVYIYARQTVKKLRRLIAQLKNKPLLQNLENLPNWIPVLLTSVLISIVMITLMPEQKLSGRSHSTLSVFLLLCYLMRDAGLLIWLSSAPAKGRFGPGGRILIAFLILYFFIPVLLNILSLQNAVEYFFPNISFTKNQAYSSALFVCPLFLSVVFWFFACKVVRREVLK